MQFNPDCARDVLLTTEALVANGKPWEVSKNLPTQLTSYTYDEVIYHIRQCKKLELIELGEEFIDGTFDVCDLTPSGHRALAMIRNPKSYQKARSSWLEKVRDGLVSASISEFFSVAFEIVKGTLR